MDKRKSHAFGKDVYLLGRGEYNEWYWLESPSWDCERYWGFGYIVTYTCNKQPELAGDILSLEHAASFMSKWFIGTAGSKPRLKERTFTDQEGWELSELFVQFYFLKSAAKNFGQEVNEIIIPQITARILEILTPGVHV